MPFAIAALGQAGQSGVPSNTHVHKAWQQLKLTEAARTDDFAPTGIDV